jgi:prepilin-type processing-associated H-X9-DG protein
MTVVILGAKITFAQPSTSPREKNPMPEHQQPVPAMPIEQALQQYVSGLNSQNPYFGCAPFVAGAKIGYYGGPAWGEHWIEERHGAELQVVQVQVVAAEQDKARAIVQYRWKLPLFQSAVLKEEVNLVRQPDNIVPNKLVWKILPGDAPKAQDGTPLVLNATAAAVLNPEQSIQHFEAGEVLGNLRVLSTATLTFLQDYDEVFAFQAKYREAATAPYMRGHESSWDVPGTERKFQFNENLTGWNQEKISAPHNTVLLYDGQKGALNYEYEGKAAVAFADGHAELVSPERAKSLIWKPKS